MSYYYSPLRKSYEEALRAGGGKPAGSCPFCENERMREQGVPDTTGAPVENEHYRWVVNWFPKMERHTMLVPKRHIIALKEETPEEMLARHAILLLAERTFKRLWPESGIDVFLQTGKGSQSSIAHLHWHVSPALPSDPVRGMEKMNHHFTTDKDAEKILLYPIEIHYAREELQKALSNAVESHERW